MLTIVTLLDMRYPTKQSKHPKRWAQFSCSYCSSLFEGQKDSYVRQDHCGCQRGLHRRTHGMTGTSIYASWCGLKSRCTNPNYISFNRYGGRGITYNPKWETFEGFYEDMGESHIEGYDLDRIDVNDGYYKENCQWLTRKENIIKMHADKDEYILYLENKIKELEVYLG